MINTIKHFFVNSKQFKCKLEIRALLSKVICNLGDS